MILQLMIIYYFLCEIIKFQVKGYISEIINFPNGEIIFIFSSGTIFTIDTEYKEAKNKRSSEIKLCGKDNDCNILPNRWIPIGNENKAFLLGKEKAWIIDLNLNYQEKPIDHAFSSEIKNSKSYQFIHFSEVKKYFMTSIMDMILSPQLVSITYL